MDYSLPGSSVHGTLQARILEWVAIPFSRASSQLRDQTQVSHIAGGFFTIWATREAQEHWSPSLLQGIFPTQESNWSLQHCRQTLYRLTHQGILYHLSCQPLCAWDFPGKNTEVGCHFLLQGIFWNQGSNLGLLHCRWILHHWAIWEAPIMILMNA